MGSASFATCEIGRVIANSDQARTVSLAIKCTRDRRYFSLSEGCRCRCRTRLRYRISSICASERCARRPNSLEFILTPQARYRPVWLDRYRVKINDDSSSLKRSYTNRSTLYIRHSMSVCFKVWLQSSRKTSH